MKVMHLIYSLLRACDRKRFEHPQKPDKGALTGAAMRGTGGAGAGAATGAAGTVFGHGASKKMSSERLQFTTTQDVAIEFNEWPEATTRGVQNTFSRQLDVN